MNITFLRKLSKVVLRDFRIVRENCFFIAVAFLLQTTATALATEPPITAVTFAPDGKSVVATSQSGVHVYGWPNLDRQRTIRASASNLHCLAFSPGGDRLAVGGGFPSEEGSVQIFSWPEAESITTISQHDDSVLSVLWRGHDHGKAGDGLLSASLDREIKLADVQKKTTLATFRGHSRGVSSVCLLKDGKTMVSGSDDQTVRVWDLESGELARSLSQHTKAIYALALRPATEGLPMVASAAADRTIRFWQPTIGRMVRYVRLDAEPLCIAWQGDGNRIAAGCVDGHVRIIDANEVKLLEDRAAIDGWVYAIAVHPDDGSLVIGGSDGQIKRLEPNTAER